MRLASCAVSHIGTLVRACLVVMALMALGPVALANSIEDARARYLASGDTVRGVNLGGWLVTERWCVSFCLW
jgi:hypothetical protein